MWTRYVYIFVQNTYAFCFSIVNAKLFGIIVHIYEFIQCSKTWTRIIPFIFNIYFIQCAYIYMVKVRCAVLLIHIETLVYIYKIVFGCCCTLKIRRGMEFVYVDACNKMLLGVTSALKIIQKRDWSVPSSCCFLLFRAYIVCCAKYTINTYATSIPKIPLYLSSHCAYEYCIYIKMFSI